MIIDNQELNKILNLKESIKLIKDMSQEEKNDYNEFFNMIPKKVIENIKDYPESNIHSDKRWKIVDYIENPDGSGDMSFIKDDEKIGLKEMSFSGVNWLNNEELFKLEEEQFNKGILKEISERTVEKHISNETFKEEDLDKIKIYSRFGTKKILLGDVAEIKNSKMSLK